MENDYRIVLPDTGVCLPRPVFSLAVNLISTGFPPAQIQMEVLFRSGYDLTPEGSLAILKEIAGLEGLALKDENGNVLNHNPSRNVEILDHPMDSVQYPEITEGEQVYAEPSSAQLGATLSRFQDLEEAEPLLHPTDRAEAAIEEQINIARRQRERRFGDRAEDAIKMQIKEMRRLRRQEKRRNSEGPLYSVSFSEAGDYQLRDRPENIRSQTDSSGTFNEGVSSRYAERSQAALEQAHERAQVLEAEMRADLGEFPIDPALMRPQTPPQHGLRDHLPEIPIDDPVRASVPKVDRSVENVYVPLLTYPRNDPQIRFASLTGPPARLGNWPHGTRPRVRGMIRQYELPPVELEGWKPEPPLFEERNEEVDESLATLWP